jgi:hypothetical protein
LRIRKPWPQLWVTGAKILIIVQGIFKLGNVLKDFLITGIIPFVTTHATAFKGALLAIGAVLAGAAIVGGILAIVGALSALINPITAIVVAVGLLGAAWASDFGGMRTATENLSASLKEGDIPGVLAGIRGGLAGVANAVADADSKATGLDLTTPLWPIESSMAIAEGALNRVIGTIQRVAAVFQITAAVISGIDLSGPITTVNDTLSATARFLMDVGTAALVSGAAIWTSIVTIWNV